MIFLVCLSAVITATGLTYVISEKYRSTTNVLIRPQKSIDMVPKHKEILNFPVSYYTPIRTASKTYTEIVKSRVVSEKVVKILGLDVFAQEEGTGVRYQLKRLISKTKELLVKGWTFLKYGRVEEQDPFNYAVTRVQKSLSVKPTKETYLFELKAEARSPVLAAAIANTAAKVLAEYLQGISSLEKEIARQLSTENLEPSRQQLDQARKALVEFKEKEGIVSLREETALQLKLLFDLENTRKTVNTEIEGTLARKEELSRQLVGLEDFSKSAEKVIDNPIVRELKLQLAQKEVALVGMRKKYTPEYQDLQAISAEIAEIKEKLKEQPTTLNSEVTTTVNPIYQSILKEGAELESHLESLKARSDELSRVIQAKREIIDQLPLKESRLANLELAVALEEQRYMFLSKELQELTIAANQDAPNIRLINDAVAPLYPSSPIKVYHAGLAAILSLIAGIGMALLKEHMNSAVRSVNEAEQVLALPVLMTVPKLDDVLGKSWPLMGEGRKELPEVNRKHKRAYVHCPIEVKGDENAPFLKGELVDISLGGACFRTEAKCGLGAKEKVDMEIDLVKNSGEKVFFEGVVVRSEEHPEWGCYSTVAVEFLNLNEALAAKIEKLFEKRNDSSLLLLPPDFEEPIRGLRSDMQFFSRGGMSSFLITSCCPQEGKSTIATNLTLSLIATNKTAVLIDANSRHPSLHEIFGLPNETGLLQFLSEGTALSPKKVFSGLSVLTSGAAVKDPAALLGSEKMEGLIRLLKKSFDFVLIDAPALLSGPDSVVLASTVDGVVLVLNTGTTTIEDGKRSKQILDKANAKILGIVMNNYNPNFESYYTCCGDYPEV